MRYWGSFGVLALLIVAAAACSGQSGDAGSYGGEETGAQVGVDTDVGAAILAWVDSFDQPPEAAGDSTLLGEGALALDTTDGEEDADSLWVESIDINSDGETEETQLVWDDEDGILYAYARETFACLDGEGTADGGMLVASYAEDNTVGAPRGSGWYAIDLDAGECYAQTAMLWGCEFDETGMETACGEVVIDGAAGTMQITTLQQID